MKRKAVTLVFIATLACGMMVGCGEKESNMDAKESEKSTQETVVSDQEAADRVAKLIDDIYVQKWTENTDQQCKDAKAAWDALTEEQKEMVEGEAADPDYFGKDTGDASKDDPRNSDDIGEKELLVVSFGTSYNDSRVEDIHGIEEAVQKAYPDWSVRRAFTSQIIINHIQAREGVKIDNMEQALQRAVDNGVKDLIVLPTHLMHGAEYDELASEVEKIKGEFQSVKIAEPLLGPVGSDASVINQDKKDVAEAVVKEALKTAGYKDISSAQADKTAIVLLGHGTTHTAKVTYSQMQTVMENLKYHNVFVGTVEGEPEDTTCEAVIEKVQEAGYKKVILRPLMVVAGDHANNDMAGDEEDSWKQTFLATGRFDSVDAQIAGLGGIADIQAMYVAHVADAMDKEQEPENGMAAEEGSILSDGTYDVDFTTDSSMFHVNETKQGKGILTVKDAEMTLHITLTSKNIVNLFLGKAQDARKESAKVLNPTEDEVEYEDGTKEVVNGFDVPVSVVDEEFDLALLGQKGIWYDHKVSISNPQKID